MLNAADYQALLAKAKVVSLKFRKRIYPQDSRVDAVYFPLNCMVSLLVTTNKQSHLEMATIGKEGVLGGIEVLLSQVAFGASLIQIAGSAVRIPAAAFLAEVGSRPRLQEILLCHQLTLTRQILQSAACNRLHSMEERCARWLLLTHDRAGQDRFPITQEFLSHMLGVRRATVNVATGMLKKAGFIHYVRGYVMVVNRAGLESAACECYQKTIDVYRTIMKNCR
jgi:CRP-like cAMP-binding protein